MTRTATPPKADAKAECAAPGVISPSDLYTVEEARCRLRIGQWAWRQWRRDGLCVLRVSGRAFVTGRALIEYLERHGRDGGTS